MPRRITKLEQDYNKLFPGNPATLFEPTEEMLRRAIETNTPISEEEVVTYLGKENYDEIKAHLESWYEMEITWK